MARPSSRAHLGPTAQAFHEAFGLGADDKHLAPKDLAGVALVGVKELHAMIKAREAEIAALKQRLGALEAAFNRALAGQGTARLAAIPTGQHH
jgi:hypothetical protein